MRHSRIHPSLIPAVAARLAFFLFAVALSPVAYGAAPSASLQCDSIPSTILGRSVDVCVALPPDYERSTRRYPVLYFLHGLFENEHSWIDRGGRQTLESLWGQGEVGDFLVVLPDGGKTFYVNAYGGHDRYEDFVIQELVPTIDRKYRTMAERRARGISGSSMGGYGALHLAMDHPDLFGSASAHSAALISKIPKPTPTEGRWGFYAGILQDPFGSPLNDQYFDENNPLTLAEHPERFSQLKLYFDCGDHDRYGFEAGAQLLHEELAAKNFPHEYALRPGNHGWSYLNQYLKFSLTFHWHLFAQAEQSLASASDRGGDR